MRYVFVSDIHGKYDKLIEALESVSFNQETDTLVSVGDPFDRGSESKEVLEFIMSCPHRILIWGNHDARLYQLMLNKDYIAGYDFENGIPATLHSFTLIGPQAGLDTIIHLLNYDECYAEIRTLLYKYFRECVWAIEFDNLIATHAWLPTIQTNRNIVGQDNKGAKYELDSNWRNANKYDWYETSWCHSQIRYDQKCFPEKPLLIGHWHAWRLAQAAGEDRGYVKNKFGCEINCDKWISPDGHLIAIDGCSNWPFGGKVNVFEYNSDKEPIKYAGLLSNY